MRFFAFFILSCFLPPARLPNLGKYLLHKFKKKYKAIDLFSKTANFQSIHFQDEASKAYELVNFTVDERPLKLKVKLGNDSERDERCITLMGLN